MRQTILATLTFLALLTPPHTFAGNNDPVDDGTAAHEAAYLLGISHRRAGTWDEAAASFQKALGHEPLADYSLFYLGEALTNKEEYQAALGIFKALTSKFPESRWKEEAGFKTADLLFRLGRYSEARLSFERFTRDNPGSPLVAKARMKMAEGLEKEGKLSEAYDSYKSLWLKYPSSPESRTASVRMADLSSKKDVPNYHSPLSIDERYGRVTALLSNGVYKDGINELLSLIDEVQKGGTDRPKWFAEALLKLGEAYYQTREDGKAEAVLKKVIETASSPDLLEDALLLYGKALQRSEKRGEAVTVFERIIKDYPKKDIAAGTTFRLADMAEGDGDLAKAKDLYRNLYIAFPKSSLADDALWKEGWLFYREKDYKNAYLLFGRLLTEYPSSEFADTATYWSARTAEKVGMTEEAAQHYVNIINNFPLSYYTVLSRERVPYTVPEISLSGQARSVSLTSLDRRQTPDKYLSFHLTRGKTLLSLGFKEDAAIELSLAESRCSDKKTIMEIAGLMLRAGDYYRAQRTAFKNLQKSLGESAGEPDAEAWRSAFPTGFSEDVSASAEKNSLSPYLIHAIIREESSYRVDAISRAGAIGLMQLMPSTGSNVARETGFRGYSTQSLYTPETNITLGSFYLKRLIDANKGSLPLAIASYNAGPNAVSSWISKYGTEEMDEFIEKIPYSETRNYVKRVLRSYELYGRLFGAPKTGSEKVAAR
ncbi:MAG: tetratricopeptide repeat protein [Deltaproteobacteria bacterium]